MKQLKLVASSIAPSAGAWSTWAACRSACSCCSSSVLLLLVFPMQSSRSRQHSAFNNYLTDGRILRDNFGPVGPHKLNRLGAWIVISFLYQSRTLSIAMQCNQPVPVVEGIGSIDTTYIIAMFQELTTFVWQEHSTEEAYADWTVKNVKCADSSKMVLFITVCGMFLPIYQKTCPSTPDKICIDKNAMLYLSLISLAV